MRLIWLVLIAGFLGGCGSGGGSAVGGAAQPSAARIEIGTQAVTLIFKRLQEKVSADAGPLHVSVKGRLVPRDSVRRLSAAGKTAR